MLNNKIIEYIRMKKLMLDKIEEYMKGGNIKHSKDSSIIQTSIEITPKRRIKIDEYRRRVKTGNPCEILEDSPMKMFNQKDLWRINAAHYRQRKRDEEQRKHPKPKPLTAAELSKRYREKKKNMTC